MPHMPGGENTGTTPKNTIMKKVTLLIPFLALCISSYAGVKVNKSNGGPNGYETIDERHTDTEHWLNCFDPGYAACAWSVEPCDVIILPSGSYSISNDISPYVETQIAQNVLQGVMWLDNNTPVIWNGTDQYNYSIFVNN